ncbi:Geranylgeranyl diphosphate synthase [Mycena venus]|uniref:(2E,6E)-farnesyl diphosphate synthase n=1 Tax=Mycena venus TaxID=2733690 RepID=A0A8H6YQG4_9AGAR|nr:Geranylgeranyl diphosphate synthase [Mycena venus]
MPNTTDSLYDNFLDRLATDSQWSERDESRILEPFSYITAHPGKDIRTQFIESFNLWLDVPVEKTKVIGSLVNMLHTASLLVDDIEDNSTLRRGVPVAHKIYGIPQTINTANYVYFLAFQKLFSLREDTDHDLDAIITTELVALHRGQGLDLLWRDCLECPTEDEYVDMVNNKTGGLLRIGIKLMMAMARSNIGVNYVPFVNLIGVYFQIRDDLMNLSSVDYTTNKGFAEDLTEGKFSFPVIHAINKDKNNRQIINVLQKRPTTPTLKLHTIEYLRNTTRSFHYTLGVLGALETQIRMEITRLGGNAGLEKLMDRLHVDPTTAQ